MNMQSAFTGLTPSEISPSPTSILLNRNRPEGTPETINNTDPANQQHLQYSHQLPSGDIVFQTPVQNINNYRAFKYEENPSVLGHSRRDIGTTSPIQSYQQQVPIVREGIQVGNPVFSPPPNYQQSTPSKGVKIVERSSEPRIIPSQSDLGDIDEQKRFYKTLILQYQKNIEALKQQLTIQTGIIKQLQSQAVKIRGLQDTKVILQSKFKDFQKQRLHYLQTIRRLQGDKQRMERENSEIVRSDELIRVEIFSEIQKVRRELSESKRKEMGLEERIMEYQNEMKALTLQKSMAPNFDKIRADVEHKEKQIIQLQQILTQYEAESVKHEMGKNQLFHKIKSLENTVGILEKQIVASEEIVKRKSNELVPIKALQGEVESLRKTLTVTQTNLTTETQKFSLILSVKEEELIKLRALLETQELKFQQISSRGNEGSKLLLKQIEELKDTVYKRELLIGTIQQNLIFKEKELGAAEIENNRVQNKLRLTLNQHEVYVGSTAEKLRELQSKNSELASRLKSTESEVMKYSAQLQKAPSPLQQRVEHLTLSLEENRKETFMNKKVYQQKIFTLQNLNNELEMRVRQLTLLSQQKEGEKQHFEEQNKTLYSNYIELRKELVESSGIQEQNKLLKLKLSSLEEEISAVRLQSNSKKSSRTNEFRRNEQSAKAQHDHRGDQQGLIYSLRSQNHSLKISLEQAADKIEEYSSAVNELQQLRGKILQFQSRAQRFLGSGRTHQYYTSDQEHRGMLDEVVSEMAKKLKRFKKQNKELKKQVRTKGNEVQEAPKSEKHPSAGSIERARHLEEEQKAREGDQERHKRELEKVSADFQKERERSKDKEHQRINQIKEKMVEINKSKTQEHNQKLIILTEENQKLNQLIQQYQQRIKQYQTLFLKFKNRQNRATEEMAEFQEQQNIEYRQQMIDNAEDFSQAEERAHFFRQKNVELENRVEQLLAINLELKGQLEQQSEMIKVFESGNLYRHQIVILEQNVGELQGRLDRTIEENNRLKEHDIMMQSGMGVNEMSSIKIQHLSQEVHALRGALAEAQSRNHLHSVERYERNEESSELQLRVHELERIINRYETEKDQLISQNEFMNSKLNSLPQPQGLLNKIHQLEQQVHRLQEVNHRLNLSGNNHRPQPHHHGVLEAYHHLLNEVDKLLQRVDLVRTYTLGLVDLISENKESEFISELEHNLRKIAEFLEDVDAIRHSIISIKKQQERQMLRGEATMYLADI